MLFSIASDRPLTYGNSEFATQILDFAAERAELKFPIQQGHVPPWIQDVIGPRLRASSSRDMRSSRTASLI